MCGALLLDSRSMCDRCHAIDAKIARYRRLADIVSHDMTTLEHLNAFILDLESDRTALHSGVGASVERQT
jgi:hypothetical protein